MTALLIFAPFALVSAVIYRAAVARENRTARRIAKYTDRQRERAYWTDQANKQVWI